MDAVRSRGELRLRFCARSGRTRLAEAYQSGCLRARMPTPPPGTAPCVVVLNTSGGLAGGDRLLQSVRWDEGSAATVATQAAEKTYRSLGDDARIEVKLDVGSGARAEWLPQEAILFDRARLSRSAEVSLSADADFLGVESAILGRTAMGETVRTGKLRDAWRIVRDGRLIYADVQQLEGAIDTLMQRPATGAGAKAFAVLIHVASGSGERLGRLREALAAAQGRAAASAWNGMLVARLLPPDGEALRHDLALALSVLRDGRALPRVWTC